MQPDLLIRRLEARQEAVRKAMAFAARGGVKHPEGATKAGPDPGRRRKNRAARKSRKANR